MGGARAPPPPPPPGYATGNDIKLQPTLWKPTLAALRYLHILQKHSLDRKIY